MSSASDFVIENGVLKKYTGAGGDVVIPDGVTSIGKGAFSMCHDLQSVILPGSVTTIGDSAFSYCSSLTSITIPEGVTSIGNSAFDGCSSLTNITLPKSATSIGNRAFYCCRSLTRVVIPESATIIGDSAFSWCSSLTSITIPDSVNSIGKETFYCCECLQSIALPEGVTDIGDSAFYGCTSLNNISLPYSITAIGISAFSGCANIRNITLPKAIAQIGANAFCGCSTLQSIEIPKGITKIGISTFEGCSELQSVLLPDTVTMVCDNAFKGCSALQSITLPESVAQIQNNAFDGCISLTNVACSEALKQTVSGFMLPTDGWGVTMKMLPGWMSKAKNVTAQDAGWILIYQTKAWRTLIDDNVSNGRILANDTALEAIQAVNQSPKELTKATLERVRDFLVDYNLKIEDSVRKELVDALQNNSPKVWKKIEWKEALEAKQQDPLEEYVTSNTKHADLLSEAMKVTEHEIPYSDGSGNASRTVVAALLAEYMDLWNQAKETTFGEMTKVEILTDVTRLVPSTFGDELAAKLDRTALSAYLLKLTGRPDYRNWLLCFVQYATQDDMTEFIRTLSDKPAKEAIKKQNASIAVAMSNTRAAMLFAEKMGTLEQFAKYRGTDADTIRDTVLADFGLDADGKKEYDLGGTSIVVSLQKDLTLGLFDTKQNKVVKSIPKKGNDESLVAEASADFAELKKNVKKVAKSRSDRLFNYFLSGEETEGLKWKNAYLPNPLLRHVAELIVWEQSGQTFTLKDGGAVLSDGTAYEVADVPISVAHPIEMKPEDLAAWQKYFASNGLKQPFAQIWERAIDPATVKEDRYSGCTVPINFFRGAEKHGLSFYDNDFHNDIGFEVHVPGCRLEGECTEWHHHELLPDETFTLGKFTFKKYTRQVNHLVTVLDRWTVYDRIKKDDVSVAPLLDNFTLAQITEFINAAQENSAVNVLALLLNYRNEHYADYDPMEEFTLDW